LFVTTISFRSEAFSRGARMLRTALGPAIAGYLEDPGFSFGGGALV
jgi:type IV secretion system protein VirB11